MAPGPCLNVKNPRVSARVLGYYFDHHLDKKNKR